MANLVFPVVEPLRVSRSDVRRKLEEARTRGVVVAGLGLTGIAACKLFSKAGISVTAIDEKKPQENLIEELNVKVLAGEKVSELKEGAFALFSPGIAPGSSLGKFCFERGIPSLSELDLLGELVSDPLVGITGTNGKSTTTTLVFEMLKEAGQPVELVGNVGVPFVEVIRKNELFGRENLKRKFVAEISSYQLEWAEICRPKVSIWLNLAENHLERHGTMENYLAAKSRLIESQNKPDFAILSAEDPNFSEIKKRTKAEIVTFGSRSLGENSVVLKGDNAVITLGSKRVDFSLKESPLIGAHNRMNLAVAGAAALLTGGSESSILKVIREFRGLEHRLESVPNRRKVVILNDSKATSVHAAASDLIAVKNYFSGKKIVLLLGGQAKQGSWTPLVEQFGERVRMVVGFGRDGKEIVNTLSESVKTIEYITVSALEEAVKAVSKKIEEGEILLFAPACASYDAYSGFEERGRHFKKLVEEFI